VTYDDFGREIRRATSAPAARVIETSYLASGQVSRRVTTGGGVTLRDETYAYDARSRLREYRCEGSQPPMDGRGRAVLAQRFTFDRWSNVTLRETTYADGQEVMRYTYSAQDPTQLSTIEQDGAVVALEYDAAGNLTRDERGQRLRYDSQSR